MGKSSFETVMLNNFVYQLVRFVYQLLQGKINSLIFLFVCLFSGYKLIGSHSGVKLCRWTKVCSLFFSHFINNNNKKLETYSGITISR